MFAITDRPTGKPPSFRYARVSHGPVPHDLDNAKVKCLLGLGPTIYFYNPLYCVGDSVSHDTLGYARGLL